MGQVRSGRGTRAGQREGQGQVIQREGQGPVSERDNGMSARGTKEGQREGQRKVSEREKGRSVRGTKAGQQKGQRQVSKRTSWELQHYNTWCITCITVNLVIFLNQFRMTSRVHQTMKFFCNNHLTSLRAENVVSYVLQ